MRLFGIFLLLCFALVLTPKNWWHHCNHSVHQKKSEQHHEHAIDEDCPICDLSLSVFTQPSPLFFQLYHAKPYVHDAGIQQLFFKSRRSPLQLRAPPSDRV